MLHKMQKIKNFLKTNLSSIGMTWVVSFLILCTNYNLLDYQTYLLIIPMSFIFWTTNKLIKNNV